MNNMYKKLFLFAFMLAINIFASEDQQVFKFEGGYIQGYILAEKLNNGEFYARKDERSESNGRIGYCQTRLSNPREVYYRLKYLYDKQQNNSKVVSEQKAE